MSEKRESSFLIELRALNADFEAMRNAPIARRNSEQSATKSDAGFASLAEQASIAGFFDPALDRLELRTQILERLAVETEKRLTRIERRLNLTDDSFSGFRAAAR